MTSRFASMTLSRRDENRAIDEIGEDSSARIEYHVEQRPVAPGDKRLKRFVCHGKTGAQGKCDTRTATQWADHQDCEGSSRNHKVAKFSRGVVDVRDVVRGG